MFGLPIAVSAELPIGKIGFIDRWRSSLGSPISNFTGLAVGKVLARWQAVLFFL
jgi:hypothetical protein